MAQLCIAAGFELAAGAVGVAAAVFWFRAKFPTPQHIVGMFLVDDQGAVNAAQAAFKEAWSHANGMNSIAATLTGIAALLGAVGAISSALGH